MMIKMKKVDDANDDDDADDQTMEVGGEVVPAVSLNVEQDHAHCVHLVEDEIGHDLFPPQKSK